MPQDPAATPQEPVTPSDAVPQFTPSSVSPDTPTLQKESQPSAESAQADKPLTREEILQIVRSESGRIANRTMAQGEDRIQKQIREQFAALDKTKSVLKLSDADVQKARQDIVTEAFASPDDPGEGTQDNRQTTPPADNQVQQAIQFLNTQIGKVFQKAGVTIDKNDPEYEDLQKAIDAGWVKDDGLVDIIEAAQIAAQTKTARLRNAARTGPARIAGQGPTQSTGARPMSAMEKISAGLKQPPTTRPPTR